MQLKKAVSIIDFSGIMLFFYKLFDVVGNSDHDYLYPSATAILNQQENIFLRFALVQIYFC